MNAFIARRTMLAAAAAAMPSYTQRPDRRPNFVFAITDDLEAGRAEVNNLAGKREFAEPRHQMKAELATLMKETGTTVVPHDVAVRTR